jgi:hypothetical protein
MHGRGAELTGSSTGRLTGCHAHSYWQIDLQDGKRVGGLTGCSLSREKPGVSITHGRPLRALKIGQASPKTQSHLPLPSLCRKRVKRVFMP